MGLTSALYSSLTGLNANQQRLDVIGNNISNVNTIGFKSSRLDFQTLFSQTLSNGGAPGTDTGGTNPIQVGLGTKEGAITRDFNDGSTQVTGVDTELAIQGGGFFVLQQGPNQVFSRDGTFKLDSQNNLVNASGSQVQGYGVDTNFNILPGVTQNINIPLGTLTVANPTTNMVLNGSLNGSGPVATQGAVLTLNSPLYLAGAGAPSGTPPANSDLLTNIVDATNTAYFQAGDVVTVTPPGSSLAPKTLAVTSSTTLQDFTDFMSGTLGIDTATGANGAAPDGAVGIQAVSPATATFPANSMQLTVNGNVGTVNDLALDNATISIKRGASTITPFTFTQVAHADGESTSTQQTLFDSLGSPVNVNVSAVLVGRNSAGTSWNFYVTSPDGTGGQTTGGVGTQSFVGSGTLSFDVTGKLTSSTTPTVIIDRSNTGAAPLLQFGVAFKNTQSLSGGLTGPSSLTVASQDGFPKGVLNSFLINNDGTITGKFTNGMSRTLAQVALATFHNDQGLIDAGNNSFVPGANSGQPQLSAPGQFSTGTIVSGALELSNVDLSQEFVNLISASTGFSASSRIITTSNQLLQELLQSAR